MTFEEGTWAAWLHDPAPASRHPGGGLRSAQECPVESSETITTAWMPASKLSELLYLNKLSPVYHGEQGIRTLKELARSYITITRDLTWVMSRLKAIYRSLGNSLCHGQQVYAPRWSVRRWLAKKISEAGVRLSCRTLLPAVRCLGGIAPGDARRELLAEARKHPAMRLLRQDSCDWSHPCRSVDRSNTDA